MVTMAIQVGEIAKAYDEFLKTSGKHYPSFFAVLAEKQKQQQREKEKQEKRNVSTKRMVEVITGPHPPMTEEVGKFAAACDVRISRADLDLISQLIFGYLGKRPDGRRILFKLLKQSGLKTKPGDFMKTYYKEGYLGMDEYKLSPDELEELHVWMHKGDKVVSDDQLEILSTPDKVACEECGVLTPRKYCSANVVEVVNGREHMSSLCNHCRLNKDVPRIKDTANYNTCRYCPMESCTYHPDKTRLIGGGPALDQPLDNFSYARRSYSSIGRRRRRKGMGRYEVVSYVWQAVRGLIPT